MQTSPPLSAQQLAEFSSFAQTLADRVRPLSRKWFRHALSIDTKADASPVTQADREVEAALREAITQRYPDHGIFGEEFGALHAEAELVWSLDPIDGTRAFISGNPLWGTLLALLHQGKPVLGVIDIPMLEERWIGAAASPARLNGEICRVSACTELRHAILYATSPDIFEGAELAGFNALAEAARMRRFGGDCYSYGLLASGHVDLVVEAGLQPYDYLALMPVIEGAGGVITDWSGQPLCLESLGRVVAAATPQLHRQAMRVLGAALT
ncbi:histidinol-phosphatase [Achromobacter seleniivolatilans]|uniref:Histidinol-phosphatase n=1 Tax=Achromobacter seleniivolatilans TaxID=3047478 RepID=A0ABY9LYF3_9BURK|nr:histidinol-phosphatase [Achromobacter sp. R39]WMD19264.1 histidinol-phosphatase [Achromobacter sp. R39]